MRSEEQPVLLIGNVPRLNLAVVQYESVQFLLRHGAAWALRNDQQETAEDIAQQKQHWDIYNTLKKARVATEYESKHCSPFTAPCAIWNPARPAI